MVKISHDKLEELILNSIDDFHHPKGNYWIYHDKRDNNFYGVKHAAGIYFISTGTSRFTEVLRAMWCNENQSFVNPSSCKFWN